MLFKSLVYKLFFHLTDESLIIVLRHVSFVRFILVCMGDWLLAYLFWKVDRIRLLWFRVLVTAWFRLSNRLLLVFYWVIEVLLVIEISLLVVILANAWPIFALLLELCNYALFVNLQLEMFELYGKT